MNILTLLPLIIVASGIFLLIKLRFFFIIHPKRTLSAIKRAFSGKNAFSTLCLSLAGTLGVGNIVGVAFGISVGGAGSVFWLFVSCIFSLVLKFSEATLASDMKRSSDGGMIELIGASFTGRLKILAPIYSVLCLLLSLSMGSALQARAAIEITLIGSLNAKAPILIFTALVALAIFGGASRIEKFTSFLIPIATVSYIALTLAVILLNFNRLPLVFVEIIQDAFSFKAGLGGISAFVIASKMREGFSRGLLSNEAGAGTSAFAHTRNDSSGTPAGLVGMCEVFFDTVVLCMLTAFAVLLTVPAPESFSSGIEIVLSALSSLGVFAQPLLSFCIFAFAYSTVICWYYYGKSALSHLTKSCTFIFPLVFLLSVFWGAVTPSSIIIVISDYVLFFLTAISLFTVIKNSDRLVYLSEMGGLITKGECGKAWER